MIRKSAFLDASAVIPLCITQPTSATLEMLTYETEIVIWWATSVEVHSAIARLHRTRELNDLGRNQAFTILDSLADLWREIEPNVPLRAKAQSFLHNYPLRAADSLQLAAASVWAQDRPSGKTFMGSDLRLCAAAEK